MVLSRWKFLLLPFSHPFVHIVLGIHTLHAWHTGTPIRRLLGLREEEEEGEEEGLYRKRRRRTGFICDRSAAPWSGHGRAAGHVFL